MAQKHTPATIGIQRRLEKCPAIPTRPKLAALVYRATSGCRQYPFPDADTLQSWAARHPYRNETLRIHVVGPDGKMLPPAYMPAAEAAAYVRKQGGAA